MKKRNISSYIMILLCLIALSCRSKSLKYMQDITPQEQSEIEMTPVNASYKELALAAIQNVIDTGDTLRIPEYFSTEFILHKDAKTFDIQELANMVSDNKNKDISREVGRVIGEGNEVGVHSRRIVNGTSYIVADFFKFDQRKITGYWMFVQKEIVEDSPESISKTDMFAGDTNITVVNDGEQIQKNKSIAQLYMTDVLNQGNIDIIDNLLGDTFTQHSSTFPSGKKKFIKMIDKMNSLPNEVKNIIAEGDYVWLHTSYPTYNLEAINIFRMHDNRIVEHWDVFNDSTMVISNSI